MISQVILIFIWSSSPYKKKKIIVNIEGDGNECNTISRKQTTKSSDPEQTVNFEHVSYQQLSEEYYVSEAGYRK